LSVKPRAGGLVETGSFGLGVRMRDVKTGQVIWEIPSTVFSDASEFEFLSRVELGKDAIYVGGSHVRELSNSEMILRAYDYSGKLLWEDRAHLTSLTAVGALALNGQKLFVVGTLTQSGFNRDAFIRAYDVTDLEGSDAED